MPSAASEPAVPSGPEGVSAGIWRQLGLGLGLGRVALGVLFWVAPVVSVRVAGLDAVTSRRVDWLARMTAARDVAIGAGTAAAVLRPAAPAERAAWFAAGALCDLGDTVSIRRGAHEGRLATVPALLAAGGAAVTGLVGLAAAAHELAAARALTTGSASYEPAPSA